MSNNEKNASDVISKKANEIINLLPEDDAEIVRIDMQERFDRGKNVGKRIGRIEDFGKISLLSIGVITIIITVFKLASNDVQLLSMKNECDDKISVMKDQCLISCGIDIE